MAAIGRYINLACSLPLLVSGQALAAFMHASRWKKEDDRCDDRFEFERGECEMLAASGKMSTDLFPRSIEKSWSFRCFRQREIRTARNMSSWRNESRAKWDIRRGEKRETRWSFFTLFLHSVTDKKKNNHNSFVVLTNLPAMLRSYQVHRKYCRVSYNCILLQ